MSMLLPDCMRDKNNREIFIFDKRYTLPINDAEGKGSVTCLVITVSAGAEALRFYRAFRRFLKSQDIPVVEYCYKAGFREVLCGKLPEQM